MKRYILFAFNRYYPNGGMNDFAGSFDTKKELRNGIKNLYQELWYEPLMQVYDLQKMKIVLNLQARGKYGRR